MSSGCVHVYTGNGKGKTTAALGVLCRAVGAGQKVALVQFDKGFDGNKDFYSERNLLRKIKNVDLFTYGCSRVNSDGSFRMSVSEEDKQQAQKALSCANQLVQMKNYDLIILDEIITAASVALIKEDDMLELVKNFKRNRQFELILTGRGASENLIKIADLTTEMKCVRHYFEDGRRAKKGIDY